MQQPASEQEPREQERESAGVACWHAAASRLQDGCSIRTTFIKHEQHVDRCVRRLATQMVFIDDLSVLVSFVFVSVFCCGFQVFFSFFSVCCCEHATTHTCTTQRTQYRQLYTRCYTHMYHRLRITVLTRSHWSDAPLSLLMQHT